MYFYSKYIVTYKQLYYVQIWQISWPTFKLRIFLVFFLVFSCFFLLFIAVTMNIVEIDTKS